MAVEMTCCDPDPEVTRFNVYVNKNGGDVGAAAAEIKRIDNEAAARAGITVDTADRVKSTA